MAVFAASSHSMVNVVFISWVTALRIAKSHNHEDETGNTLERKGSSGGDRVKQNAADPKEKQNADGLHGAHAAHDRSH